MALQGFLFFLILFNTELFFLITKYNNCLLDDIFKSTLHRVINRSGLERYSIPLFFGTDYDVPLEVSYQWNVIISKMIILTKFFFLSSAYSHLCHSRVT